MSRTVEFVNALAANRPEARGAVNQRSLAGPRLDPAYIRRYARTIEEYGFDSTLIAYGSATTDQYVLATAVVEATERLKPVVAVRPNTAFPTVAAQALSTLDQLSGGRITAHIISGGSDEEQRRQGDYLSKQERYERSAEFIEILRKVWTSREAFSHEGTHYRFEDFGPGFPTFSGDPLPVSIGGSSEFAYRAGAAHADIFTLWGEPLAETKQQIETVRSYAREAGRTDPLRFWVTFRPIVAETEELAWKKAARELEKVEGAFRSAGLAANRANATNVGTLRLRDIAAREERHDRALWTPKSIAGAGGASSLLVGTPETVAAAILDYVELGADIVSLPSLRSLDEAVDSGRYVIPLVRQELAHRAATRGEPAADAVVDGSTALAS